jgi:hypothetical protein
MTRMRAVVAPAVLAAVLALAGAGCGGGAPAASAHPPAGSLTRPAPAGAPSAVPSRQHRRSRAFTARVSRIRHRSEVRYSWHPGCPVAPSGLRLITMTYRGFDHRVHTGWLVVNAAVTGKLILVFGKLFAMRYPIRTMVPADAYRGSDYASIQADNTSAFNSATPPARRAGPSMPTASPSIWTRARTRTSTPTATRHTSAAAGMSTGACAIRGSFTPATR